MTQEKFTLPKKWRRALAALGALMIAAVAFVGGWFGYYFSLDPEIRTFLWAKGIAEKYFYLDIDETAFYERLYDLLDLDPYSQLFPPAEYDEYIADGAGQNTGVGLSLSSEGTLPLIALVIENSPASRAGIKKGMYILGYGDSEENVQSGSYAETLAFLRETTEKKVLKCGFSPDGSDAELFSVARTDYQAAYCYYRDSETAFHFRYEPNEKGVLSLRKRSDFLPFFTEIEEPLAGLDEKTAYIRLDEFSGFAAEEFEICLSKMKERGRTNLILDLRSNGGGYLSILQKIAGHLMRNVEGYSPLVATAVYKNGKKDAFYAPANDFNSYFSSDSKVKLLADERTASASECLIGALVDYGTIGYSDIYLREDGAGVAKTYGKGIMQSHYKHPSGAAMKLTVATIHWPKGNCIHGVGVTKSDGANAVLSERIWGATDPLLSRAIADLCLPVL